MQKLIGSILIVAGTTIGAGMLAMPIISANVGFLFMSFILFCIWFAMFYTSVLLVNVYRYNSPEDGLNTLTTKYLGKPGAYITGLSMLTLMYALTSAYIAGGGDILRTNLEQLLHLEVSPQLSAILFTLLFGGIIAFGTRAVDYSTKVVFSIKILCLCLVLGLLLPHIEMAYLAYIPQSPLPVLATIPIIFTSFGFSVVIPSLVKYLDGNLRQLKWVFFIGSIIPLLLYLIWELTILGNIESSVFSEILKNNAGLEGLLVSIKEINSSPFIKIAFTIFAAAAILTSFWGVALALNDYIKDLAKDRPKIKHNVSAFILTFLPPILFALFYPDGFVIALGYASISLVVLALIIPMLMLQKAKKIAGEKTSILQYIIYGFLWILSLLIVVLQLLLAFEVLPS
ncbi:aromatic amino acid transport family protein [Myroides odoratus]|jgi:tyrosine-specific transport protein|uniref:Tyrosine permease n=1 Tax=Myroides odoratus TaxID=256 RepID=A0A378RTS7_MYROD|nr:aromatic amino acid transport family protein [Myroides odoratus]MDH6599436.1 tyrosine-specific transport protein [Myroides gitamensis]EHQ41838.1 Tryptophan/tyrosine permease [Myroides odoratus DSM 2801]EKB08932.1 aromatic amino acid transporter [Myroides odoratus CIP 103059]MCS4240282.1 tyrosine-specific transport protein [Myroides odoratus]QQT99235.1 tyrosine transporter TyrP [Myroides odoratus]